jgi:diketogulonate reductase-like aldo/keto reductase
VAYSPYGHDNFRASAAQGRKVLDGIAAAHGATARQVALRFLVREPRCSRYRRRDARSTPQRMPVRAIVR